MKQPLRVEAETIVEGFRADGEPILHTGAALLIQQGHVHAIGNRDAIRRLSPQARVLDAGRKVVIPGLINAHHHVGLTPLQMGSPDYPLELWFASRLGFRSVDLYTDTLYSAFEMIRSGVTTVQHLHSRVPGKASDLARAGGEVVRAYLDIGMRASYSIAMRDQNRLVYEDDAAFVERVPVEFQPALKRYFERFATPLDEQIAAFKEVFALFQHEPRIGIQLAPANLHWLSDRALAEVANLSSAYDVPMHMHLLETPYQKVYAGRRTGESALRYLDRFGLLGPRLTIGHGVWMNEDDIALCAHTGTRLCHNCSSNLRLKSGRAPVNRFIAEDIPVALGLDEAGINDDRDMLQEMRLVLRMHRDPGINSPCPSPSQVLRMATEHGAGSTPFGHQIGSLSEGSHADFVVLDWDAVTYPWQSSDIPLIDVLVQRARSEHVMTVAVAGDVIYDDRRFLHVDEKAVLADIHERMQRPLTDGELESRDLARGIFPTVREFYESYD